jgi:hypothetical protein
VAGDGGVGGILLEASAECVPRIRCKTRLIRSSITAAVIMIRRSSEEWAVSLPDNEDAGVFGCGIAISIWRLKSEETFVRRFAPRLGWSSARSAASACRRCSVNLRRIHHLDCDLCRPRRIASPRPGPHAPCVQRLAAVPRLQRSAVSPRFP